jgi:ABC-type uncharacterized transport system permease subunit
MDAHSYLLLALAFYSVGVGHVVAQTVSRRRIPTAWTAIATLAGFAVHTASLAQRWTEAGHFPAVGLHDGASFLGWAVVLAFLTTYMRTGVDALGLLAFPAAFALVTIAFFSRPLESRGASQSGLFLPIHTTLALFGYGALFVAFAMGILYLVQERELKSRSPHTFYYLIPSLERCDTISGSSVKVGFGFLTLAIITGMLWSHSVKGAYLTGDAKEWAALIAWLIYVVLILARTRSGWGGRRAALLGIAGFAAVVFTFAWRTLYPGSLAP